jgi:hypothetical protein
MQHHTVQRIEKGANEGRFVYTGGNRRMGRYVECCDGASLEDPGVGHATEAEAYAHMRERLLKRLDLDGKLGDWSGCRAPAGDGRCDTPTKGAAQIPPCHFLEPLCDEHRTREIVEAMWSGPGDWSGSW